MAQWRNDEQKYGLVAVGLHWLIGLMIITLIAVGLYMAGLPDGPGKFKLYGLHKASGATLLVLVLIRLAWRVKNRPPPLPQGMPMWQVKASHGVHHLLYLLMLIMPLSGVLLAYASGYPWTWFGLFPLPVASAKIAWLQDAAYVVHSTAVWLLIVVIVLHVLAALKHQFVDKDGLLARMSPWPSKTL